MTMFVRYTSLSALALLFLTGCAHTPPDGARLSTSDAIRIAKEAAKRGGIVLSDYKRPEARYRADKSWFVFFDGRGLFRTIGSHFAVIVDDKTEVARVVPGA